MDIIYKLTNISKSEGKRFYIGSKAECHLGEIDGIPTIICNKTNKPYYSSSQSHEFKADMLNGDKFSAEILKLTTVGDRYNDETVYLKEMNVSRNDEYYNLSDNATGRGNFDDSSICNIYGETYRELAYRESSLSKRDASANKCGFDNFGEMIIHIIKEIRKGVSMAQISRDMGRKRHYCRSTIEGYDLDRILHEIENKEEYVQKIREYLRRGASFYKSCEMLGITIFSGRVMIGNYSKEKSYAASYKNGLTKEEMEDKVIEYFIETGKYNEISSVLGITSTSAKRYLIRGLKRRLS